MIDPDDDDRRTADEGDLKLPGDEDQGASGGKSG